MHPLQQTMRDWKMPDQREECQRQRPTLPRPLKALGVSHHDRRYSKARIALGAKCQRRDNLLNCLDALLIYFLRFSLKTAMACSDDTDRRSGLR